MLTSGNFFDHLVKSNLQHAAQIAQIVNELREHGLYTSYNFDMCMQHADPVSMAVSITYLHSHKILNHQNQIALLLHPDPLYVAFIFYRLSEIDFLNQTTRTMLIKCDHMGVIHDLVDFLKENHCFDQTAFVGLMRHAAIFTHREVRNAFKDKLANLFTESLFFEMLALCDCDETSETVVSQILALIDKVKAADDYEKLPFYKKASIKITELLQNVGLFEKSSSTIVEISRDPSLRSG